jgi:hypothetical protein
MLCRAPARIPLLFLNADGAANLYIPLQIFRGSQHEREQDETAFENHRRAISGIVRAGFGRDDAGRGERR